MKNKETKLIKEAYGSLAYVLNSQDWTLHGKVLFDVCYSESKNHDRWRGGMKNSRGISVTTEAKYFAIRRIVEYLRGDEAPDPKCYISMQKSCFYAYGLIHRFPELLRAYYQKK